MFRRGAGSVEDTARGDIRFRGSHEPGKLRWLYEAKSFLPVRSTRLDGLAFLAALNLLVPSSNTDPLVRDTTLGPIRGIEDRSGTLAWLGVPYAAPPVGPLRWKAPQRIAPWREIRPTERFGRSCLQVGGVQGPGLFEEPFGPTLADAFGKAVGSEDCLTLNVWRPPGDATGLPVVVFVHGGANVAGYSADPLYHGAALATRINAVVITLNYRLGVLGWFAHPAITDGADSLSASGNLGLLDLIAALQFVQANGHVFGGDPGNVTLMGQSAGAVNSFALMVSPLARGLFHRVVALSGALLAIPHAAQQPYVERVVGNLTAPRGSESLKQYLYDRSGAELVLAAAKEGGGGLPTADGVVLPLAVGEAVKAGQHAQAPILFGTTTSEGKFFVQGVFRHSDGERFRSMLAIDPDASPTIRLEDVLLPVPAPLARYAEAVAAAGKPIYLLTGGTLDLFSSRVPVYSMRFGWERQPEPWRALFGATHGMDLPFLFGNFGPSLYSVSFTTANRPGRLLLSVAMADALKAFVRTGTPRLASGDPWPAWRPGGATALFDAGDTDLRLRLVQP